MLRESEAAHDLAKEVVVRHIGTWLCGPAQCVQVQVCFAVQVLGVTESTGEWAKTKKVWENLGDFVAWENKLRDLTWCEKSDEGRRN